MMDRLGSHLVSPWAVPPLVFVFIGLLWSMSPKDKDPRLVDEDSPPAVSHSSMYQPVAAAQPRRLLGDGDIVAFPLPNVSKQTSSSQNNTLRFDSPSRIFPANFRPVQWKGPALTAPLQNLSDEEEEGIDKKEDLGKEETLDNEELEDEVVMTECSKEPFVGPSSELGVENFLSELAEPVMEPQAMQFGASSPLLPSSASSATPLLSSPQEPEVVEHLPEVESSAALPQHTSNEEEPEVVDRLPEVEPFAALPQYASDEEDPEASEEISPIPLFTKQSRSTQLERTAKEADVHTQHGFMLAGRGALFSARAEFIAALRLIAQGLDAEYRTQVHSRSLASGLIALKEADDFVPRGSRLEADLDFQSILKSHNTPILKEVDIKSITPMEALKCYMTYAQEQLATAVNREVAGSMALRGLGKLYLVLDEQRTDSIVAARSKGMVFFQSALLANSHNYMAANDLGVLLAGAGRYVQAKKVLELACSERRSSTAWLNLAVVYRKLGRNDLARLALNRSGSQQRRGSPLTAYKAPNFSGQVRWLPPSTFVQATNQPASAAAIQAWNRAHATRTTRY